MNSMFSLMLLPPSRRARLFEIEVVAAAVGVKCCGLLAGGA